MNRDPIGYAARTNNLYEYVLSKPSGVTDPLGLFGPGNWYPDLRPACREEDKDEICGLYVIIYTGSWCESVDSYEAALEAAGELLADSSVGIEATGDVMIPTPIPWVSLDVEVDIGTHFNPITGEYSTGVTSQVGVGGGFGGGVGVEGTFSRNGTPHDVGSGASAYNEADADFAGIEVSSDHGLDGSFDSISVGVGVGVGGGVSSGISHGGDNRDEGFAY